MNPVLDSILRTQRVRNAEGNERELVAHVSAAEGEFLQRLIRETRPQVTLEVGLGYGVSTLFICEALREVGGSKHIVCDPDQFGGIGPGFGGIGLQNVKEAGYEDLVEFHSISSHVLLPKLEQAGQRVDFAFVDGWHTFDYTLVEFFYIDRILQVGGIMAFDDLNYPSVTKACRYALTNRAYRVHEADTQPPSWKRRLLSKLGEFPFAARFLRSDIVTPNFRLGLSGGFVALQKTEEDSLGGGQNGTRRWDQHTDF